MEKNAPRKKLQTLADSYQKQPFNIDEILQA